VQETAGVPSAFVAFGISKGFFRRHGLNVDLQTSQGGAATVPALVSGKIQVAGSNVVSLSS
jgi:NitT/TauT family transport system substrate-binding protein